MDELEARGIRIMDDLEARARELGISIMGANNLIEMVTQIEMAECQKRKRVS